MTADEKTHFRAILPPEERCTLEGDLGRSADLQTDERSAFRRSWLVLSILICAGVVLLSNKQLWKQASTAGKKLESEVESVAASVKREVVNLTESAASPAPAAPLQQPTPIELVNQNLSKSGLPIPVGSLRMKLNPIGEGIIVYSPHYFGRNRRFAWIVIDGQAYTLTDAAQEATPRLPPIGKAPTPFWKKTGLSGERPLSQLEKSLWGNHSPRDSKAVFTF